MHRSTAGVTTKDALLLPRLTKAAVFPWYSNSFSGFIEMNFAASGVWTFGKGKPGEVLLSTVGGLGKGEVDRSSYSGRGGGEVLLSTVGGLGKGEVDRSSC
jgi:hypothetical protein